MKKYLHIASDEKFIDSANWQFEQVYPGGNHFFIIVPDVTQHKLKHIKQQNNIKLFSQNRKTLETIVAQLKNYDLVFLHSLDYYYSMIVNKAALSVKFVWIFWGYEVYKYYNFFARDNYGDLTQQFFFQDEAIPFKVRLIKKYHYYKTGQYKVNNTIFKAHKRVDYFCGTIKEEFELFSRMKIISAGYINWSYYPIEFIFNNHDKINCQGKNIMVGNSANPTNNHIEVFKLLKEFNLENRKVIVPLSYGNLKYAEKLIPLAENILGQHFNPLTQFYPLEEYNNFLRSCNILIMNQYRQQGFGNVLAMLWLGAKVYMDERNIIYQYLKRIGVVVFSIKNDLSIENEEALDSLSIESVELNKRLIFEKFGKKALLSSLKKQLEIINQG